MASLSNNTSALSHLSAVAQHLVFTLLLLALGVTNAQAAETIFSLEVTATQEVNLAAGGDLNLASYATISGGSALVHNGHSNSAAKMIEPGLVSIKNSGGSYLKITLTSGTFQTGDVISIGTSQSDATFYFTGQSTKNESIPVAALTYTVTSSDELNNKNVLYIWRNTNSKLSSLTITRPAASYTYTINAVDNSTPSNFIKTIATGTVGDQAITVYHQKIINVNGTFYETNDMTFQHDFAAATGSSTNVTVNVVYKVNNKIRVYIEGENYTSYTYPTGNYSNGTYGNVIGGTPAVIAESLPAGKYTFKAYLLTNDPKSAGRGFYVRDGSVDDYSKQLVSLDLSNPTNKEYIGDFEIYATKPITLAGWQSSNKSKTNQSADFDYAYIEYKSAVTPVTSISLDKSTLNFTKTTNGFSPASATLTATLSPNNPTNKDVIWTSDDTNIATVSSAEVTATDNNGNLQASVTVTAKGPGTAVITAKAKGGGDDILATCTVNITGNSTVNDLTEITSNYSYSPNQEFIRGVLYNNNTLLSINGDEFYEDGVNVGGTSKAIAFKVAANATVRVTFKNRGGDTRIAQIGTSQNGTQIASQSLATGKTAEVVGHPSSAGVVYLTSNKPLYITKIEVLFSPKYTVTYNGNGHGTPGENNRTESSPLQGVTLPTVTPKSDYDFIGWATTADATTADAGIAGDVYYPSANVTLYALYRTSGVKLASVVVNYHSLVADNNNTYSYKIGNAYTGSTMDVVVTPSSDATVSDGSQTGTKGAAITTTVTIGTTKTLTVNDDKNNSAVYTIRIIRAANIDVSGDSYAIENKTYYEGQIIDGTHIDAYISPTAGGALQNSANSNYGELTTTSQAYNGDITYAYRLQNDFGHSINTEVVNPTSSKCCYYAFTPTVDGVLEVAVNMNTGKKLIVSDGTNYLTKGTNYTTSFDLDGDNKTTADVSAGSIRINVTANTTYYVYGIDTKMVILGFALNEYLYVTSEGQTYTLSSTNYANDAFFTKDKATATVDHGGVQIYRIKNSSDKVTIKVKNAKSVAAVIYNSAGSARSFTISVDGVIVGTEAAAANCETTSQYYTIDPNGSTITLAGTGSDIYAYQLIFSENQYSSISVKDGSNNSVTAVTKYVDDNMATYTVSSNSSATINLDQSGVSGIAGVTLSNDGTLTIVPSAAGTGNIVLSQAASGDYQAGSRTIALTVKKHSLKLILTHNGSDSYTHNITTNTVTGSYYKGSNDSYGGSSTAWTVTALKDGDETQRVESGLTYSYHCNDNAIATVAVNGGATTILDDAIGTAYITVYTEGNDTYEAAKTQFSVTVQQGYDVKINSGVTPALNSRYEAKRGNQVLCTMIAGGYKYNSGTLFGAKDNWGKSAAYDDRNGYSCQIDGFIQQSQAGVDSSNEFGQGIEWYNEGKKKRIKPFSLPVRGAYLKFEPEVNGVLTAYVLQNGDITTATNGDGLPYEIGKAPRVYYWFDQNGFRIEPTHVTSKLPLCYGRDYTKDGVQVFYDNGRDDHNLNDWYINNSGLQTLYETEGKWPTQAEVDENLAKIIPDPQPVVRYNDGYSVHQKAYVKYQLKVIAGNTYYFFSNVSKVGFAGFNFNPSDDGSLTCVAYNDNGTTFNIDVTTNETQQTMDQSTDTEDTFKPKEGGNIKNNAIVAYETVKMPRTFKVNTWNTITLPFSLTETQVEQVFGVGTILVTYNGVGRGGGQSTAFFLRHVDQNILAGQPYFIKPTGKDAEGENLSTVDNNGYLGGAKSNAGITFKNVNCEYKLESQNYEEDSYKGSGSCACKDTDLKCVGTLAKTDVATGDYFINVNSGDLVEYTGAGTQMNAYRAFLKQSGTNPVKLTSVNYSGLDGVDWEDEATGIMEVLVNDLDVEIAPVKGVYNLNGQKVGDSTKGLPAGLYIVNGKVINIK